MFKINIYFKKSLLKCQGLRPSVLLLLGIASRPQKSCPFHWFNRFLSINRFFCFWTYFWSKCDFSNQLLSRIFGLKDIKFDSHSTRHLIRRQTINCCPMPAIVGQKAFKYWLRVKKRTKQIYGSRRTGRLPERRLPTRSPTLASKYRTLINTVFVANIVPNVIDFWRIWALITRITLINSRCPTVGATTRISTIPGPVIITTAAIVISMASLPVATTVVITEIKVLSSPITSASILFIWKRISGLSPTFWPLLRVRFQSFDRILPLIEF